MKGGNHRKEETHQLLSNWGTLVQYKEHFHERQSCQNVLVTTNPATLLGGQKKNCFADILHTFCTQWMYSQNYNSLGGSALPKGTRRLNMLDIITTPTNQNKNKNMHRCVYIDIWKPVWLTDWGWTMKACGQDGGGFVHCVHGCI